MRRICPRTSFIHSRRNQLECRTNLVYNSLDYGESRRPQGQTRGRIVSWRHSTQRLRTGALIRNGGGYGVGAHRSRVDVEQPPPGGSISRSTTIERSSPPGPFLTDAAGRPDRTGAPMRSGERRAKRLRTKGGHGDGSIFSMPRRAVLHCRSFPSSDYSGP